MKVSCFVVTLFYGLGCCVNAQEASGANGTPILNQSLAGFSQFDSNSSSIKPNYGVLRDAVSVNGNTGGSGDSGNSQDITISLNSGQTGGTNFNGTIANGNRVEMTVVLQLDLQSLIGEENGSSRESRNIFKATGNSTTWGVGINGENKLVGWWKDNAYTQLIASDALTLGEEGNNLLTLTVVTADNGTTLYWGTGNNADHTQNNGDLRFGFGSDTPMSLSINSAVASSVKQLYVYDQVLTSTQINNAMQEIAAGPPLTNSTPHNPSTPILNQSVVGYSQFSGSATATFGTLKDWATVRQSDSSGSSPQNITIQLQPEQTGGTNLNGILANSTRTEMTVVLQLDLQSLIEGEDGSSSESRNIFKATGNSTTWGVGINGENKLVGWWKDNAYTQLTASDALTLGDEGNNLLTLTVVTADNGTTLYWGTGNNADHTQNNGDLRFSLGETPMQLIVNGDIADSVKQLYVFNQALSSEQINAMMAEILAQTVLVPEPTTIWFALTSLAGLCVRRRK